MYTKNNNRRGNQHAQYQIQASDVNAWSNQRNSYPEKPIPPSNYSGTLYISDSYGSNLSDRMGKDDRRKENSAYERSGRSWHLTDDKNKRSAEGETMRSSDRMGVENKSESDYRGANPSKDRKKYDSYSDDSSKVRVLSPNSCCLLNDSEDWGEYARGGFPTVDWSGKKGYFRRQIGRRCLSSRSEADCEKSLTDNYTVSGKGFGILENISLDSDDIILAALIIMLLSSKSSGEITDDVLVLILAVLLMSGFVR